MPTWKKYKLKEVCTKIGSGATPSGGDASYKTQGISLIRSQNVLDFEFSKSGLAFIDEAQAKELRNVEVKQGDVLLNITGDSVARVCQVPSEVLPARVNQHVLILRADKEKFDSYFLKYALLSRQNKEMLLSLASTGATRKALTKVMLENFEIEAPTDLPTQTRIASILSALDDKIELNRQMNQTLEQMAQALFKKYFVDDIDPDNLPEGWRWGSIYDICNVIYGAAFSSKNFNENRVGLPLVRIRDLKDFNPQYYTDEKHPKATIIEKGDVIVGMDAEFKPCIWQGISSYLNQRVCQFKPNQSNIHNYYLYETIRPHLEFFEKAKVGTTVIHLGKSDIDTFKVIIPPNEIFNKFYCVIDPIFQKRILNTEQATMLASSRNTLLPKLMSGEIDVNTKVADEILS